MAYGQTFGPNSDAFVPFEFCPYGEFSNKGDSRYRKAVSSWIEDLEQGECHSESRRRWKLFGVRIKRGL